MSRATSQDRQRLKQTVITASTAQMTEGQVDAHPAHEDGREMLAEAQITQALGVLRLAIEPFDDEQARMAGILRLPTRPLGLSLGDRACLALAKQRRSVAVTTDRAWSRLPADLGLSVRIVR